MRTIKYSFCVLLLSVLSLSSLRAEEQGPSKNKNAIPSSVSKTPPAADQVAFIGDYGNHGYGGELGSCPENFWLGRYEFTVQNWYTCLLFAASDPDPVTGKIDPHHLWKEGMSRWIQKTSTNERSSYVIVPGKESYPITNISLLDCYRACNIRHNLFVRGFIKEACSLTSLPTLKEVLKEGEGIDAITEHGAYEIIVYPGGTSEVRRQPNAIFYIPSRSQWVKAGYYKGGSLNAGYYSYPTRHDNNPGDREGSVVDNKANYNLYPLCYSAPALVLSSVDSCGWLDSDGKPCGTYSSYGCFDMAGNVNEWTDTQDEKTGMYIVMGGDYKSEYSVFEKNYLMLTCTPQTFAPNTTSDSIGFRMAADEGAFSSSNAEVDNLTKDYSWYDVPKEWNNLTTAEQIVIPTVGGAAAIAALVGTGYGAATVTAAAAGIVSFAAGIVSFVAGCAVVRDSKIIESAKEYLSYCKDVLSKCWSGSGSAEPPLSALKAEGEAKVVDVAEGVAKDVADKSLPVAEGVANNASSALTAEQVKAVREPAVQQSGLLNRWFGSN